MKNKNYEKITEEITKTKSKISELQSRLRELERQKTDLENDEIVSLVRGLEIPPDKFREFVAAYQQENINAAAANKAGEAAEKEENNEV